VQDQQAGPIISGQGAGCPEGERRLVREVGGVQDCSDGKHGYLAERVQREDYSRGAAAVIGD
jgi:hypothetical protein